jgi:Ala-tRNA(Pro) deacylase
MPAEQLLRMLDNSHVPYHIYTHPTAYSAQEIAAKTHIPGRKMAKTVIVRSGDYFMMVVLPAANMIDFALLEKVTGFSNLRLADEVEFNDLFPDCEMGAMPPFGNMYGMPVYVDTDLIGAGELAFNVGSHTRVMVISAEDYLRLVQPSVETLSVMFEMPGHRGH